MEVLVDRCAGLDVHKKTVVACVRTPGAGRQKRVAEVRTFGTFEHQLIKLREWLDRARGDVGGDGSHRCVLETRGAPRGAV